MLGATLEGYDRQRAATGRTSERPPADVQMAVSGVEVVRDEAAAASGPESSNFSKSANQAEASVVPMPTASGNAAVG